MTSDKSYTSWYFLAGVLLLYLVTYILVPIKIYTALNYFVKLILKILPTIGIIFILMALANLFIKPKTLVKYLGHKSGIKGWILAITFGILSTGPIYMWYPLLNDLQKQGMRSGLISAFLYNRAVKIPLLPLIISYFGLTYSVVLIVVMIFISIVQGWTTEKIMDIVK